MQENGFSLEEYTQFIKAYLEDKKYLFEQAHRAEIEIYYVPAKRRQNADKNTRKLCLSDFW